MALTDNLVSFWSLEESTGTRLDSHGSNHMSEVGTLGSVAGKVGTSASFANGSSNYLSITSNSSLSGGGGGSWTFCGWIYRLSGSAATPTILSKISGDHIEFIFYASGTQLAFEVYSGANYLGGSNIQTDSDISILNTWDFFVIWYDASNNTINIELNGNGSVYSDSHLGGVYAGSDNFEIGRMGSYGQIFDGYIDQVGFWHRALSSGERTQLYNSGNGLSYAEITGGSSTSSYKRLISLSGGMSLMSGGMRG